jgi:glutamine amidotransferase
MCRFAAYIGRPIIVDELLFKPANSLVKQSVRARETDEPLNGDGFGLGWYAHEIDYTPALFTSVQPAWNDRNLLYISPKIRTNCLMAHVRAASSGGVSILNCHPFHHKRLLFMHNGSIGGFQKIKRYMRRDLPDCIYDWIKGQTDSEHMFAVFLHIFEKHNAEHTTAGIAKALLATFQHIAALQKEHGIDEPSYLNVVITDGLNLVASRYSTVGAECPPTLYYSAGSQYEYHDGVCHMHPPIDGENEALLIVSEKLTSYSAEWQEIPENHLLLVHQDLSLEVQPIA